VRINRNSNSKVPFGFVVFEDEASVQQVLLQKVRCVPFSVNATN